MVDQIDKEAAAGISQDTRALSERAKNRPAGADSAYVPDREVFDAYTHQQIWDAIQPLAAGALGDAAAGWRAVGLKLDEVFHTFTLEVKNEFAEWSGSFADTARNSTDAYSQAGGEAGATCSIVGALMDLNSSAAQNIRASIPEPLPPYVPDPDPVVEAADGGDRRRRYNEEVADLTAAAQDTMTYLYNPTLPASGDSVPRFVAPPIPIVEPPPVGK